MKTDSYGLREGAQPLSSNADFIALAVIALTLGVMGAGDSCSFETLFRLSARVEASSPATDLIGTPRAGTGWLCW